MTATMKLEVVFIPVSDDERAIRDGPEATHEGVALCSGGIKKPPARAGGECVRLPLISQITLPELAPYEELHFAGCRVS